MVSQWGPVFYSAKVFACLFSLKWMSRDQGQNLWCWLLPFLKYLSLPQLASKCQVPYFSSFKLPFPFTSSTNSWCPCRSVPLGLSLFKEQKHMPSCWTSETVLLSPMGSACRTSRTKGMMEAEGHLCTLKMYSLPLKYVFSGRSAHGPGWKFDWSHNFSGGSLIGLNHKIQF